MHGTEAHTIVFPFVCAMWQLSCDVRLRHGGASGDTMAALL